MKSRKKTVAIVLLSSLLMSAGVYLVLVPLIVSKQYADRVYSAAQPLEATFRSLGKSTELPLLTDPSAPAVARKDNADQIAQLVKDARQEIDSLKRANGTLEPPSYSDIAGQYRGAEVLQERAQRLVEQSEDALDGYSGLVVYLEAFNNAADSAVLELSEFNNVYDLNSYAGRSENMQQIASRVRTETALIANARHSGDMETLSTTTVKALNEAADGFDDLASGLAIPADDPIYAAARKIEGATRQMDAVRGEVYAEHLHQSRAIKNVQDLTEKLELVLVMRSY